MNMRAGWRLALSCFLILGIGACADVPYVFGEEGAQPLNDRSLYITDEVSEHAEETYKEPTTTTEVPLSPETSELVVPLLSDYPDSEVIEFTTASGPAGGQAETKSRTVGAIKEEINEKIDVENEITRNAAVVIAAKFPGEYNIDQIASIHKYLKDGWHYVTDVRGIDYYSSASNSLTLGKEVGCVGIGDCDDFAILMSAMVEAIGGTTRIVLAYNKSAGHAYTEVYLGQLNASGSHVQDIINWLRSDCNTNNIYTHIDPSNKDVWLNLDWSAGHPGGPFWKAEKQKPILIREQYGKVPPGLPEGYVSTSAPTSTSSAAGKIQGQVVNQNGMPLISKIILTDENGNTQLAVTDRDGNYEIQVEPGSYDLTAEKSGYYFESISVNAGSSREVTVPIHGEKEYEIESGVTLGAPYNWADDKGLADYYK